MLMLNGLIQLRKYFFINRNVGLTRRAALILGDGTGRVRVRTGSAQWVSRAYGGPGTSWGGTGWLLTAGRLHTGWRGENAQTGLHRSVHE